MASPWVFGFAQNGAETWVPVILGGSAILYSLLTNYEMGVAKTLSLPVHLGIDIASGMFLAMSPWLFGFADYVYMPHLIFGIGEILIATLTDRVPYRNGRNTSRHSGVNYSH
jgi:hypothetical protein